jgi:hypothetical protein
LIEVDFCRHHFSRKTLAEIEEETHESLGKQFRGERPFPVIPYYNDWVKFPD